MFLPAVAFGALSSGVPDIWSEENREYWSAKIEVVPFVRQATSAGEFTFVANESASAIEAENIYYAIKLTVSDNVYDAWWNAAHIKVNHSDISGAEDIASTLLKDFPLGSSETMSYENVKGGGVYWLTHDGPDMQGMTANGNYFEKVDDNYVFGNKNIYFAKADTANPKVCASIASSWKITENTWDEVHSLRIKRYTLDFKLVDGVKTITVGKDDDTVDLILDSNNKLTQAKVSINGGSGVESSTYTTMPSSVNPCSTDVLLTEVFTALNISFGLALTEDGITNNFGFNIKDGYCFSYDAYEVTPAPELNPAYCWTSGNPYMILENGDALKNANFKLYILSKYGDFYEQTDDYKISLEKYKQADDSSAYYRLKFEVEDPTALKNIGYFAVTAKNTNALESTLTKFTVGIGLTEEEYNNAINGGGSSDTGGAVAEQGTVGGSLGNVSSDEASTEKPEDIIAFGPVNHTDPETIPTVKIEEISEDEYTNKGKDDTNRHKPYDEMQNHANKNEEFIGAYQIELNGGLIKEGKHMRIRFKFDEEFSGKWVLILHYCKKHDRVEEWKIKIDNEGYAVIEDVDSFSPFAVYSTTEPANQGTENSSPSYSVPTYQVELQSSLGGSIGRISLTRGGSRTFTFEQMNGVYPIVYVNGVNMGRLSEYTVSNIKGSLTIYLDYTTALSLPKTGGSPALTILMSAAALGGCFALRKKR